MMRSTEEQVREPRRAVQQHGLTLFELLIVLAILALLATLVAPRVIGYLGKARTDVARTQLANIVTALELYAIDIGEYPSEAQGLTALVERPEGLSLWTGPYLREATGLTDPWGQPYHYDLHDEGRLFTVSTLGRDGEKGGEGDDADLTKS
ncbi:type II secretion system major pseudopilin GspG [Parvularcula oceani]|uniref:type II secretion system major pseudopilin GspG n=1 Tax=Parvularcula oceani TaxID=1247963 RepID=UPI00192E6F9A|nr:type II secretion system major pseudopilin GspG [Parvularcula oceani]